MTPTLPSLRARVAQSLRDAGGRSYPDPALDEAVRQALETYSLACPLEAETTLTLAQAGAEIDLSAVDGLVDVLAVVWPYDPAAPPWSSNRVRGWRLQRGDPGLLLLSTGGSSPRAGDGLRLWYTARHWLEGLDAALTTTLPPEHEGLLVLGAAGYAASARLPDLAAVANPLADQSSALERWGYARLEAFLAALEDLRQAGARRGPSWGPPWSLDAWSEE